ncbi:DNA methyltransferase [Epilithonimonas lactis]|uniref:DNA methyltransferase n=1 Tax=Epilithonimonas lactis TaxID=421072 RepID=UPI00068F0611|nr:DNA methyltransferase [Epilithonimonas lactis]SEQ20864.1 DNA methylase [Epilithonimonas lactis]
MRGENNKEFDRLIKEFKSNYKKNKIPIEISFKEIVNGVKFNERYTHQIHAYPAKLLSHIPYFFLNNSYFSKCEDIIVDPFNGSGTVALECVLSKKNFYGADANPLANLISKVKVTNLNLENVKLTLKSIIDFSPLLERPSIPEVRNLNFWFPYKTIDSLSKILASIMEISDIEERNFFLISFSSIIKKVSYCDTRISVPVKLNPERYLDTKVKRKVKEKIDGIENIDVFEKFYQACSDNIARLAELYSTKSDLSKFKYLSTDARKLMISENEIMPNDYAKLIITSPPYAGAQKYIRSSSLNLGWTNLASLSEVSKLERNNIGREIHKKADIKISSTGIIEADLIIEEINKTNSERAFIANKYLEEMKTSIDEMYRVLQKGGHIILIIGNNKITGKEFNTQSYLTHYAISIGMKLQFKLIDNIKSYGLMTKRNKTADIISREYVLVFKK